MFSGSLVAIVTPMRPDGRVDFEAWARLVDFHLQNGTSGTGGLESPRWVASRRRSRYTSRDYKELHR